MTEEDKMEIYVDLTRFAAETAKLAIDMANFASSTLRVIRQLGARLDALEDRADSG